MSSAESSERLRLFCAVELPARLRARAFDHLKQLRASVPQVKASWEREEKLHVTLKFFGATEAARLSALTEAAARVVAGIAPFELTLEDVGAFPSVREPRVLWLGVMDTQGELRRLQQQLETACAATGFARDERPFHAHVTLARIRTANANARRLAHYQRQLGFAPQPFTVNELVIMRSDLGPNGSQYTPLARLALQSVEPGQPLSA